MIATKSNTHLISERFWVLITAVVRQRVAAVVGLGGGLGRVGEGVGVGGVGRVVLPARVNGRKVGL